MSAIKVANPKVSPELVQELRHGLIEIDRQYIVGVKPCGYKLTEHGARLMYQGQMQYLKDLFTDPKLKRQM